jgi:hypothetical protein
MTGTDPNDSITITWHIDDLDEIDPSLTRIQRQAVLACVKKDHDWLHYDVLRYWVQFLSHSGTSLKKESCSGVPLAGVARERRTLIPINETKK